MVRTGFYPGSFDPITFGHLDIIARAARMVDRLVIGVGLHDTKSALLDADTRVQLVRETTQSIAENTNMRIEVVTFRGLTVEAACAAKAGVIFRGLRDASDFDYEVRMGQMNGSLSPEIETVFLAASPATRMIASSLVKQIARMGGDTTLFLPPESHAAMHKAMAIEG